MVGSVEDVLTRKQTPFGRFVPMEDTTIIRSYWVKHLFKIVPQAVKI